MIWYFDRDEIVLSREDVRVSKYQEIKFSNELFHNLDNYFSYHIEYYDKNWKFAIRNFIKSKSLVTNFSEDFFSPCNFLSDYEVDNLIKNHKERIKNVE